MDLSLDETQQMLKASAADFLRRECPHSLVREMEQDGAGYSIALWTRMVQLGWTGLAFPEEHGGAGGGLMDMAVLLEEMGRALLPGPFFSTVVLGGLTVLSDGTDSQKRDILPGICQGTTLMTLALTEAGASYRPQGIQLEARREGDGYLLEGAKLFVPDAHVSSVIVVAARTSKDDAEGGITTFLVPADSQGVRMTPHHTLGADKQSEVVFDGVRVPADSVLGTEGEGWPVVRRALDRAAAARCMEMLGAAEAVLEMTVEYAKQRVQFGRPIGSFQAVQYHCANMAIQVDSCRHMAYQAMWRLAEGLPASAEVSMAKAWVSESYRKVCALAHQSHGAIGFTKEHDLQLYTRRARAQELAYGDATYHRDLLGQVLDI
jgi:alkylation response protein AidB-like acyl-CoA dehydrogenase